MTETEQVLDIFRQICLIPRPSHHEERIADWLCEFADRLGLSHSRDRNNCVVIRKKASPGMESRRPIVILNHMDMVCVSDPAVCHDPLRDPIRQKVTDGWMSAEGTSLGADNGIGLAMALAVLQDDSIIHPALEVLTTTNEEDGMSGAEGLSEDFILGRRVLNLDSEDYDTVTVGAAGALLQTHEIPFLAKNVPEGLRFLRVSVYGGLGGHSGVDIGKGRANANRLLCEMLDRLPDDGGCVVCRIEAGEANASIPASASAVIGVPESLAAAVKESVIAFSAEIRKEYAETDPNLSACVTEEAGCDRCIGDDAVKALVKAVRAIPCGVVRWPDNGGETPVTSNNIGVIRTGESSLTLTTHTRSFIWEEMLSLADSIRRTVSESSGHISLSTTVMTAPAWRENAESHFITSISEAFRAVAGIVPRKVEMHFVLEAGYYVRKYPGIEIACIGPRIVCPHSTGERVELSTVDSIWKVVQKVLADAD